MIETIFYLQVALFIGLVLIGTFTKSAPIFAMAGIVSVLLGVQLAAGEPIEFFTWNYRLNDESGGVGTQWSYIHDFNRMTINNSPPVNSWHYILLYGGFVWFIIAFILAVRSNDALLAAFGYGRDRE